MNIRSSPAFIALHRFISDRLKDGIKGCLEKKGEFKIHWQAWLNRYPIPEKLYSIELADKIAESILFGGHDNEYYSATIEESLTKECELILKHINQLPQESWSDHYSISQIFIWTKILINRSCEVSDVDRSNLDFVRRIMVEKSKIALIKEPYSASERIVNENKINIDVDKAIENELKNWIEKTQAFEWNGWYENDLLRDKAAESLDHCLFQFYDQKRVVKNIADALISGKIFLFLGKKFREAVESILVYYINAIINNNALRDFRKWDYAYTPEQVLVWGLYVDPTSFNFSDIDVFALKEEQKNALRFLRHFLKLDSNPLVAKATPKADELSTWGLFPGLQVEGEVNLVDTRDLRRKITHDFTRKLAGW